MTGVVSELFWVKLILSVAAIYDVRPRACRAHAGAAMRRSVRSVMRRLLEKALHAVGQPGRRTDEPSFARAASCGLVVHSGKLTNHTPGNRRKIKWTNGFFRRSCPIGRAVNRPRAAAETQRQVRMPGSACRPARTDGNEGGIKATIADSFSRGSGKARPGLVRGPPRHPRCC